VNSLRNLALSVIVVMFATACCRASDIYIAQTASGGNTGADCADAYAYTFFNSSTNWATTPTSGKIGPGTTVHICGTLTAAGGTSGFLTFQGSGTSGNPITLHFESGAVITAPYWGHNGAIASDGGSYLVVDGVCSASSLGGQCTATQGTVTASLNGSPGATCPGGPCQYQTTAGASVLMNSSGTIACNDCEVRNLTVANVYTHTSTSDDPGQDDGIWLFGSNISIDNNIIHDAHWGIVMDYQPSGTSNVNIFNNTIYNVDHGIALGDAHNSTLSGLYIYNNLIHDFANWDTSSDYDHHDGIHIFSTYVSVISPPVMIYNNSIYGNWGAYDNTGIYIELYANSGAYMGPHYIFNNLLTPSGGSCANAGIGETIGAGGTGMYAYNNTMVAGGGLGCGIDIAYASGATATNAIIENNVYSGNSGSGQAGIDNTIGGSTIATSNYNDWFQTWSGNSMRYNNWFNTVALWTAGTGFDKNSIATNPNLNSNFRPVSGSPVIGAGTNLYSICNGQPVPGLGALCQDYAGNPRPLSGNWDMGAYVFVAPAPPTIPSASVVANPN
jgi:parallel beta-helix repeat protein